jgi:hypothetical protein
MNSREIREEHARQLTILRKAIRTGNGDVAGDAVRRMHELTSMLVNTLKVSGPHYVERPYDTSNYGPNGEPVYLDMDKA